MGRLTRRETPQRVFIDGLRWVDAIKHHEADAEEFANWATQSRERMEEFARAWRLWNDLSALAPEQRECIERLAIRTPH
jgi:ferric-dicitrate binding protein FerR (iron transport regulator)